MWKLKILKVALSLFYGTAYTFVYLFLAAFSTGGGHGNFFLFAPFKSWIFIVLALIFLGLLEHRKLQISFVILMLAHYLTTLILLAVSEESLIRNWFNGPGQEGIWITTGFYLFGQIVIWAIFLFSIKKPQTLASLKIP